MEKIYGYLQITAFVPMPEAAVYKDDRFVFGKHDVRFSGEGSYVQAVTKAIGKQEFSNHHLRPCVFAFDPAHVVASG